MPLHPIEKAFIKAMQEGGSDWIELESIASRANISIDQARRALEWLKDKGLVEITETISSTYSLGKAGRILANEGLPERKIVNAIRETGGITKISSLSKTFGNELSPALGRARRNGWITVENETVRVLDEAADSKEPEEEVLEKISSSSGGIFSAQLSKTELSIIDELSKRMKDLVIKNESKIMNVRLSELGKTIELEADEEEISAITPSVLQTKEWKTRKLRPIDVGSHAPRVFPGRRHPLRIFIDEVRENFVSLGFEEIAGSFAQSAFWNFDALFIPQQHPAREIQDTFYIADTKAEIANFSDYEDLVRKAHETGGSTGSLGWHYKWSEDEARRVVLRTHTTAVTISYLAHQRPDEARVFTVSRVFRNEKPTYKNNPEFYQIDGVMVGKTLNLRNLIYIISKFYAKLGFRKIKFWPTFFPYTEPSLQTMVYLESTKKWMELGGMGVFRPEVTLPLGVKNNVLAWGLGLDRLVMMRYGLNDIRQLYSANLGWLRSARLG